jgi:hypothetical protein
VPPEVELDKVVVEPAQIVVAPSICERTGSSLTITLVTVLVAEQPLDPVTVTVYEPAAVAVYEAPVPTVDNPLLQEYDVPSLADKTTLPPLQNVVADPEVIVAVVGSLIVKFKVAVESQPAALIPTHVLAPLVV